MVGLNFCSTQRCGTKSTLWAYVHKVMALLVPGITVRLKEAYNSHNN